MLTRSRLVVMSLIALVGACGPDKSDSDSDGNTGTSTGSESNSEPTSSSSEPTSSSSEPTSSSSEPTSSSSGAESSSSGELDTTGGEFLDCVAAEARDDVGFTFVHDTLPVEEDKLAALCDVAGVSSSGGDSLWAATIDLKCMVDDVEHDLHVDLELFAPLVLALEAGDQVLLDYETFAYLEDDREWLALRAMDESLVLFATHGYQVVQPAQAPVWAPLGLVEVAEELCTTEVLTECFTERRAAIDIKVGEVTTRVFDHQWAALPDGLVAHVGMAQLENAYLDPDNCIGDSIDGFQTRLIIARGQ